MRFIAVFLFATIVSFFKLSAQAPVNDNCSGALTVVPGSVATPGSCGALVPATTAGATQSLPACTGTAEDDVWFKFTATAARHVIAVSSNDPITPVIQLFQGTCTDMVSLKCVSGSGAYTTSADISGLVAGLTYYFRVYGLEASSSRTQLYVCMSTFPPPPSNDECNNKPKLSVNQDNSTTLSYSGNMGYATQSRPSCLDNSSTAADLWFYFTAASKSHTIIVTPTAGNNPVFEVFNSTVCGSMLSLACVNSGGPGQKDSITLNNLSPNTDYAIRIYDYSGTAATPSQTFNIMVNVPVAIPENDDCAGALTVVPSPTNHCTSIVFSSNAFTTQSMPACTGVAEDDVWFKFTASSNRHKIVVTGSINPVLELFSGDCGALTSLGCYAFKDSAFLSITADYLKFVPGNTYYYRVYGYAPSSKAAIIQTCIQTLPAPPANDECTEAISIPVKTNINDGYSYKDNTAFASQSSISCVDPRFNALDLWYKFVATATTHVINVTPENSSGDLAFEVFGGTCNNLVSLACSNTGSYREVDSATVKNLTIGNTYYIRIYDYHTTPQIDFLVLVTVPNSPLLLTNNGTGLRADYYSNTTLSGTPVLTRIDTSINYEFTYSNQPVVLSPAPGVVPEDKYSVRWTGKIQPKSSDSYYFYSLSDDGMRVWINGQLLVDNWANQGPTEKFASIYLTAGLLYDIVVEYYENTGEAVAKLYWSSFRMPKQLIPKSQLFPAPILPIPSCTVNNAPANGIVTGTSSSAALSWNTVAGADGYKLFVWQGDVPPSAALATVTTFNYTLTGLLPSTTYRWYIVPFNAAGDAIGCSTNVTSFTTTGSGTTIPTGNGTGLQGVYFNGTSLSGSPLLTRADTTINFELTYSKQPVVLSPASGIVPEDQYSVRWTGQVQAQYSETYTFYTVADDGVRLWVNGVQLVDNWTNQGSTEKSGSIALVAGQKYDIVIEYYESGGEAVTKLLWSSASTPKAIIPKTQLYLPSVASTGTGLQGIYYNGTNLSGTPLLTRIDSNINFELTYSKQPLVLSPAPGVVPEDLYSVRWTGQVQPLYSETYTFYTVADDGVRLWVNGQLLVDNWTNQGATEKSGSIALLAGQKYDIVIEYYESAGEAVTKLLWSSASTPKQVVPSSQLYPPAAGARIMSSNLSMIAADVLPALPAVSTSLSPNPVRPGNLARLQISSNNAGTGIITVRSSNGRMVSTEKIKLVSGINTALINTRGLAQGLYIISVTGGSKPINLKLLVE